MLAACGQSVGRTPSPHPEEGGGTQRPPPSSPLPRASSVALSLEDRVVSYIREVFGKHGDAAVRVARCESDGFDEDVVQGRRLGGVGEVGVFQIRPELHGWRVEQVGGGSLADWRVNVRVAHDLWEDQGWGPWTCGEK